MVSINLDDSFFDFLKKTEPDFPLGCGGAGCSQNLSLKELVGKIVNLNLSELDKSVEACKLDVCKLLAHKSVVSLIDSFISEHEKSKKKKNSKKAAEYRRLAEAYGNGHFFKASYYYTMAIIYAPDVPENVGDVNVDDKKVPEELSLAYGGRSAVFYKLGQHEAAVADIDHSLAIGCPRTKKPELLFRKVECLLSLKQFGEAKFALKQLDSIAKPINEEAFNYLLQRLDDIGSNGADPQSQPKLSPSDRLLSVLNYLTRTGRYQPSPEYASISSKVEPRYSEQPMGRDLMAKQDIEPGDILMVESPFTTVLGKHFEYHFCHHCCRKLESKIDGESVELCITGSVVPCTECTLVLYCSSDCRTEAWRTYHQFECSILPVLQQMSYSSHLSLRMLLTTGLDVIQQVNDRNSKTEDKNESKDPLSSLKISDPEDSSAHYQLVHSLTGTQNMFPNEQLIEIVITSAVLVQLTKKCTSFVLTAEQTKSVASILLRHLLQTSINLCTIDCFEFSQCCKGHKFAVGLYPHFSSLMNHSCEPNSAFSYVQSRVLILRATKKITAGSLVATSYEKGAFLQIEWSERRRYLLKNLLFRCECSRCVLEARDGLNGKYFPIGCKDCGSTLTRTSSSSDTFSCSSSSCAAASMSLSEAKKLYAQIETQLTTAKRLIAKTVEIASLKANLRECEVSLLELCREQRLRNCWQLGELLLGLCDANHRVHYKGKARQHFERFCEINEAYSGIDGALNHLRILIEHYKDENGRVSDQHLVEDFRRNLNRARELVRIELLTDNEPTDGDGSDLFADESRSLREILKYIDSMYVAQFGIHKD